MSEPTVLKISLNLPALERLLGGDSELEIQLRQQVVDRFVTAHLRGLLDHDVYVRLSAEWRAERDAALQEAFDTFYRQLTRTAGHESVAKGSRIFPFTETINAAIAKAVDEAIARLTDGEHNITGRGDIERRVARALRDVIDRRVDEIVTGSVSAKVDRMIDRLVEQKVRQRLQKLLSMPPEPGGE